jgi:hypothetical protein
MAKKNTKKEEKDKCGCGCGKWHKSCICGGVYGLGFIGALIYYISTATGFWVGVLGVLKAIVWPAMLIYHALKFLGM